MFGLLCFVVNRTLYQRQRSVPRPCKCFNTGPLSSIVLIQSAKTASESAGASMQMRLVISICVFLLSASSGFGQWEQLGKAIGLGRKTELGDTKIASGLKEALKIGAENAVKLTGKTDGYYRN